MEAKIAVKDIGNLVEAIIQSGVRIEELDFWQDYISIPLSAFNCEGRFGDLSIIFSRLTKFTIKVAKWSMQDLSDVLSFRKLLAMAKELRELHLCMDDTDHSISVQEKRDA